MLVLLLVLLRLQAIPGGYAGVSPQPVDLVEEQLKRIPLINKPSCPPTASSKLPDELKYACRDLAKLSCLPGKSNDGTGEYRSPEDVEAQVEGLQKQLKLKLKLSIESVLNNPNPGFNLTRTQALAATRQDKKPECLSKVPSDVKACRTETANILARALSKDALINFASSNPHYGYGLLLNPISVDLKSLADLQANLAFGGVVDPVIKAGRQSLVQSAQTERIKTLVFPRVKKLLVEKIKGLVADSKTRQLMVDKIENIRFNGSDCDSSLVSGKKVDSTFVRNAYYSPTTQEFRFCNGFLLETNSEFTLASVIAHELTHSIDPCNLNRTPGLNQIYTNTDDRLQCEKEYPFQNVIACLRTENSVGASRSDWTVEKNFRKYDQKTFPNAFCDRDQIGEAMSDWMSAEILPDYLDRFHPNLTSLQKMTGYANVFKVACETSESNSVTVETLAPPFDPHPKMSDRSNRILLANDRIFKGMGCKAADHGAYAPVHCVPGAAVLGKSREEALNQIADAAAEKRRLANEQKDEAAAKARQDALQKLKDQISGQDKTVPTQNSTQIKTLQPESQNK